MSRITELLNIEKHNLKRYIIQDVGLSCAGIDGIIAYFNFTYKDNDFQMYSKDIQAYLRIDMKDGNYKETITITNRTNGKVWKADILYDAEIPKVDLNTLI